ncbi:hypothetical protein [Bartonella elizabethae]|uniref:Tail fiber domain-containing protein n=1 Tax=Bartonella elizabethae F9251 = ATCC 49927 TaxID=1094555 RepID=J1A1Z0_BAREL|nr:hypothetical protein [Bartonella elizabethae]EJF95603.1 hypothetical protein MEE_00840 [Bartonella elizabethae F9251 = ATCC 49927]VEJ41424.1 Uncharacterised protein [Bartonella elizabethae]
MGSETPSTTQQKQVQTSAPPAWMEKVFKRGGADAYQMYNTGIGGNVYGGPRVAPLSDQTRYAIGGLGSIPHHYQNRSLMNTIYNPTSAANNLGRMASGGMVGQNPSFNAALQNSLDRVRDTINSSFAGAGRYGSGAHTGVLANELGALSTSATANQYNQDVQNMMQANAMVDQANQNQLGASNNFLQGYGNAYSNAMQGGGVLDNYNQRVVDANRERWLEQDNSGWNRLNMLMNAGHGFARNYGTTTNNLTGTMMQGNNPWQNLATAIYGAKKAAEKFAGK